MRFGTRIINKKRMISDYEIGLFFGIEKSKIEQSLQTFKKEDGQGDTVHISFYHTFADKTSFYALAQALDLDESKTQAVLAALGEFKGQQVAS